MATAAKLVSHKCTALVKVFRGTEPQSLMRQLANWLECLQSMESRMRSVKAQGPIASDNLNPIRGFNVAIKIVFFKDRKRKMLFTSSYIWLVTRFLMKSWSFVSRDIAHMMTSETSALVLALAT